MLLRAGLRALPEARRIRDFNSLNGQLGKQVLSFVRSQLDAQGDKKRCWKYCVREQPNIKAITPLRRETQGADRGGQY